MLILYLGNIDESMGDRDRILNPDICSIKNILSAADYNKAVLCLYPLLIGYVCVANPNCEINEDS